MAKKTIISRIKDYKEIIGLVFAVIIIYAWFEGRVVKAEIESMENNTILLLLPYGGSTKNAPPEVVATFNIWIKELGRKRG